MSKSVEANIAQQVENEPLKDKELYMEIPYMLFSEINGEVMFNASKYLEAVKSLKTVDDYKLDQDEYLNWVEATGVVETDSMFYVNKDGDTFVAAFLSMSFASYVDCKFAIYMHDRMHEMFSNGFVVSEGYLFHNYNARIKNAAVRQ